MRAERSVVSAASQRDGRYPPGEFERPTTVEHTTDFEPVVVTARHHAATINVIRVLTLWHAEAGRWSCNSSNRCGATGQ